MLQSVFMTVFMLGFIQPVLWMLMESQVVGEVMQMELQLLQLLLLLPYLLDIFIIVVEQ